MIIRGKSIETDKFFISILKIRQNNFNNENRLDQEKNRNRTILGNGPNEYQNNERYQEEFEKIVLLRANEIESLKEELRKKNDFINKITLEKSNQQKKFEIDIEKLEQMNSNMAATKENQIKQLQEDLIQKNFTIESLTKEISKITNVNNMIEPREREYSKEIQTQEFDQILKELAENKNNHERLKKTLVFKENEVEKLNNHINQQQESLLEYQKELDSSNEMIEHLKTVINSKTEDLEKYKITFEELNNQFLALKKELVKTNKINEDLIAKLRMSENQNPEALDSKKIIDHLSNLMASGVILRS